jgi:hypothetical protein
MDKEELARRLIKDDKTLIRALIKALDAAIFQMKEDALKAGGGRTFDQLHEAGELPKALSMSIAVMVSVFAMGYKPSKEQTSGQ